MILSDVDIKKALENKEIVIKPQPDYDQQLGACSVDFKLGTTFRVFQHTSIPFIDLKKGVPKELTRKIEINHDEQFIVQPGELVLAATEEWLELPDHIAGRLEGRSSLGRLGIIVHATASIFNPGWRGNAVLELNNISRIPVALYPGMRICAFSFEQLTGPSDNPYYKDKKSQYVDQKGAVASKIDVKNL